MMMKKISAALAATMAIASLPMFSAGAAETTYELGDVDMDGVITGHDTAMVSKYLLDDTYTLTEDQLALADVNGDGEVTQSDADMLYNDLQQYPLGNVNMKTIEYSDGTTTVYAEKSYTSISDAVAILTCYAKVATEQDAEWTQVQKNLADVNLDGVIDVSDAVDALTIYAREACGLNEFKTEGMYYYAS